MSKEIDAIHKVLQLAREKSVKAIEVLSSLLLSENEDVRLKAAIAILDRGFGKPPQAMQLTGEIGTYESKPVEREHRNTDSLASAAGASVNGGSARQH